MRILLPNDNIHVHAWMELTDILYKVYNCPCPTDLIGWHLNGTHLILNAVVAPLGFSFGILANFKYYTS